ncbi:MAG: group 1 truncated hemoglobin [Pirellulaceae bacterium]|nr:group 1 truncated hemoglobin [Pirellulaceae bacterium]
MNNETDTLFDRLGGTSGIKNIVEEMYRRVLEDPELAPFFENVPMERLRKMQYEFLTAALDGPVHYDGRELNEIHRGRGITGHHFAKFCSHFADALEANGAAARDIDNSLGRLATFKDKITGEANVDG